MIKIGCSIVLSDQKFNSKETYRCKVIDRNEHTYFADYPINTKTNKSAILSLPEQYSVTYVAADTVYEFTAMINKYEKLTVPALAIPIPNKNDIRRIQRREFVRVKTNCDIAIHCPEGSFPPIVSVTADISGGGAAVILPKEIYLPPRKIVNTYIVLRFEKSKYEYIKTAAEYVRTAMNKDVHTFSIKFLFSNNRDQEKIIQYCFNIQRERQKQNFLP